MLGAGVGLLATGLWALVWWEERPLRVASNLLEEDHAAEAIRELDQFLKYHPDHGPATALKARVLVQLGRPADACRLFDLVGAASEEEMRACSNANLMLERWLQAIPLLEYLHTKNPDNADLLHELSSCRAKLGLYDAAIDAAQKFAALPDCKARGYTLIGLLESERGNHRKACDAWRQVLEVNPEAEDLQVAADEFKMEYGSELLKAGDPAAALEQLRASVKIRPSARSLALLGKASYQGGKVSEAEDAWLQAVALDENDEESRQGLAELAMKKSEYRTGLDWLQPLAESSDLSSATAFLLQRLYTLTGDQESGRQWQSRATEIRKREELENTVDQILIDSPSSNWGQVLQAYRLAKQANWEQAALLLNPIVGTESHPFIEKLAAAIHAQGTLPDLNLLPIELFH